MTTEAMVLMFALMGLVIVVSALLSGFIERSNFPQVAAFLGLGALLGPHGLGVLNIGLDTPILRVVATLSLALILFTDALTIDTKQIKTHAALAAIILGPGTLLVTLLISVAAVVVLGLPPAAAAVLAASLSSTDLVLLRGLLRRPDLPPAARNALRLESSMNDVVLLPIVLIGMALLATPGESPNAFVLLFRMLVLGPGIGAMVAWIGVKALATMRKRVGVRRDYESLYSLGLAMAAFAAAESVHGSGFLAAFAAGLTIALIDVELCDCFREYGETTAEMLLLFTFVLLGSSLIWTGFNNVTWPLVVFVVLALAARPITLLPTLAITKVDLRDRFIISWFGPRGLSTLLLVLVAVFEKVRGSEVLFEICSLVVIVSVVIHGFSLMAFAKKGDGIEAERVLADATVEEGPLMLTVEELRELMAREDVWLLDARTESSYLDSDLKLKNAIRIDPQQARRTVTLAGVSKDAWAALFCT